MTLKKALAAGLSAGLIGMSGGAQAAITFLFNPAGTGAAGAINASVLDQLPGNALGLNGVNLAAPGSPIPVDTVITDLYQANLGTITDGTNTLFTNGTGGNFFTFVAGFDERVVLATGGAGISVNAFEILPGGFFTMCAQGAAGNNLTGAGFACGAGSTILSGHAVGGTATLTGFPLALQNLDNFLANNHPGVQTVTSNGSAALTVEVDAVNAGYFPDLLVGSLITFAVTNTSLITPFNQTDPSRFFSSDGTVSGDVANGVGAINGISGPNFQFQADANSSFERIPEPGSLTLLGLALVLIGFTRRRRSA